ncbi:MAG: holo-ACP synthase [Proteobacteria bacterium]|nr:holo-ACP synthase [Pseudomonadota bacterium]
MVIFGIGTDIVQIARIEKGLQRFGDALAKRVLSKHEFIEFQQIAKPASYLAKRFAAKEAMAKAMGTGFQDGLQLKQIAVSNDDMGKPTFVLSGFAQDFIESHGIAGAHLSLSDERDNAIAFVVLEK